MGVLFGLDTGMNMLKHVRFVRTNAGVNMTKHGRFEQKIVGDLRTGGYLYAL